MKEGTLRACHNAFALQGGTSETTALIGSQGRNIGRNREEVKIL